MYTKYLEEYAGQKYVETNDGAFVYQVIPQYENIHMEWIYVPPEKRKTRAFYNLMQEVERLGRENQCKTLSTYICMEYHGKEWSLLTVG